MPCCFLSCSERYKESVAYPIRDGLRAAGVYPVIVSEEPQPSGVNWDPDSKVDYFLDQADSVVALCTPDDRLQDETIQPRQNIIDEIQRARSRPHLRTRVEVLKERTVRLPSNINPTYDRLDLEASDLNLKIVLRQLREWGVAPAEPDSPPVTPSHHQSSPIVKDLLRGMALGDLPENAEKRMLVALTPLSKDQQHELVGQLMRELEATSDQEEMHLLASLVEAGNRIDRRLIPLAFLERICSDQAIPRRMCAAGILWDWASSSPGDVPLDLVSRLARPDDEDWYVFAQALACIRELLLSRPGARILVTRLASSRSVNERREAARILRDVAINDARLVSAEIVKPLVRDADSETAAAAAQAWELINRVPEADRRNNSGWFGL